jgi:hypothetical protein
MRGASPRVPHVEHATSSRESLDGAETIFTSNLNRAQIDGKASLAAAIASEPVRVP